MPDFNIDHLKKTWQEQAIPTKYGNSDILEMLNKKSRNYVKYILWISLAEFLIFLGITLFYIFHGDDAQSFMNIMERLGAEKTPALEAGFAHLYFIMKIISLLITGFFVLKFYFNYKKINVEANLRKFILQIVRFKKTVNVFILCNILLLIVFMVILLIFIFVNLNQQQIHLDNATFTGFLVGVVATILVSILMIWVYYRVVYGIIMSRLNKNLNQLQEIDAGISDG